MVKMLNNSWCGEIIKLVLPIQQIEFGVPVTLDGQPDLLDIEGNYQVAGGGFWGATDNGTLLGTIALINIGHSAGVVRKMFVHKDFRGKQYGIAAMLMQTLLQHCKETGITDIYLGTVDVMRAAHRFYEKNGFERLEKAHLPAYFPFMPADNMFYHLHLK